MSVALQRLKEKIAPAQAVDGLEKAELARLAERIQSEKVDLSKEQREQLMLAVKIEALEQRLTETEILALEERYKNLTQSAPKESSVPRWAQTATATMKELWEGFFNSSKGILSSIGGYLGITVPEKASDAWEYIRPRGENFLFGMLAGTLGWIPGAAEFFRRSIDIESAWNAIQLATKGAKVKLDVTLNDLKNEAKWLPLQTYLSQFPGKDIKEKVIQYVSLFISKERKAKPDATITVSMDALLDAQLTPSFAVKAAPTVAAAPAVAAQTPSSVSTAPTQPA